MLRDRDRRSSAADSFVSVESDDSQADQHQASDFHREAANSIFDSLIQGHESANIQLELTSLRMSQNASEHQVRRAVAAAFMKRITQVVESGTPIKPAARENLSKHQELIARTMFDKNEEDKEDQVDFMMLVQADLAHRRDGDSILVAVSIELYNMDVIEAEGFEQWWADEKGMETQEMKDVRGKMGGFMETILADESEEESEEESDNE